jgi:hypothetical protein
VGEDRLTQDELALVLRRAAELDVTPLPDERLPVEAVEAAAAEVGLPATAVRQAVAELRAGLLAPALDVTAAPTGPAVVVEAAVLPLEPARAAAEVGRWLEAQTFQRHRGRDGVEVWREREDWVAGLQRRFDWSAAVRLKGVHEVVVRAVAVDGGTLVRLEATLTGVVAAAPGVGLGTGGAVGVAAGLPLGSVTSGIAVVALGGGGVLGGWLAGRRVRRNRRDRIADELAAALDRLATGRTADQSALTRLRHRVNRHGGRWA